MPERYLNEDLIGQADARPKLATPALILDLPRFERNVAAMAAHCAKAGIALRPHAKTHKCVEIARRQMAAGAVGICCAKLGEAEAMGGGGIGSILITSPVVAPRAIERVMRLNAEVEDLILVADCAENAEALNRAAREAGKPLSVLVDLDIGLHRTGIRPGADALALVQRIDEADYLIFRGLQAYAGHLMHVEDFAERREKSHAALKIMQGVREEVEASGIQVAIMTGGGTGTFDIDPETAILTELQGGSYIFMDRQYNEVDYANRAPAPFEAALFVQTTVISANTPGIVTTDAGLKSFATDGDQPVLVSGQPEGASYFFFGDEQGGVRLAEGTSLAIGDVLTAVTPHCDPTVNLYDAYHVLDGDALVAIWPIEGRGRSA